MGAYPGVGACLGYYSIVNIMQTLTSFESNLQIYMYVSMCTLISYLQCMTQFCSSTMSCTMKSLMFKYVYVTYDALSHCIDSCL